MRDKTYTLDLIRKKPIEGIYFVQNDSEIPISFKLAKEGVSIKLGSSTVIAKIKKTEGEIIEKQCEVKGDNINLMIDNSITDLVGVVKFQLVITNGKQVTYTFEESFEVCPSI